MNGKRLIFYFLKGPHLGLALWRTEKCIPNNYIFF